MKREWVTLVIGGLATVTSTILALFSTVPDALSSVIDPITWTVAFTGTVPLTIILVVNQVSLLLATASARDNEREMLRKLIPHVNIVTLFQNSAEAAAYLATNMSRCRRFYNTRLTSSEVEGSDDLNVRVTSKLDAEILKAMRSGMDYFWLVSAPHEGVAGDLGKRRADFVARGSRPGTYSAWVLPDVGVPLFQFCILQYEGERELLIGWALTSTSNFGDTVFMIREARVVDYFLDLFRLYAEKAKVLT